MFAFDICYKNKVVKPNFVDGRLRKYSTISFAYNAASQILSNQKNAMVESLYIWDCDTLKYLFIVQRPTSLKSKDKHRKNESINIEEFNYCRDDKKLKPIVLLSKKENQINKEDKNKKDRVAFLKERYEKRKAERKETQVLQTSINNLSSVSLQDTLSGTVKDDLSFLKELYSCSLQRALDNKDIKSFWKTEMAMSKRNLSWCVSDEGEILVGQTEQILEKISHK